MRPHIQELLDRYLTGDIGPAEKEIVEDWFAHHTADETIKPLTPADKARVFKDLDARIELFLPARSIRPRYWLKAAAVLIIGLTAAMLFYTSHYLTSAQQVTYQIIHVPYGVKKTVTLSDHTIITLNSGSEIKIASDFNSAKRNVILTGEAYFNVHHDTQRPFIIRSGKLRTTVLGTSFNIKAYPEEKNIQVAVNSGKVAVDEATGSNAFKSLTKGIIRSQMLSYTKDDRHVQIDNSNSDAAVAWTNNELSFDNASLTEISLHLERWYNMPVKLTGNYNPDKRYTIRFSNEPIGNVLQSLSLLTGFSYTIQNKQVLITLNH